jgi:hypothetical protein
MDHKSLTVSTANGTSGVTIPQVTGLLFFRLAIP